MLFERYKVQTVASIRVCAPCSPRHQKVDTDAEARLQHSEYTACLPAVGQFIALQKDIFRLLERADCAVINVIVTGRIRRAVIAESKNGGDERVGHARSVAMQKERR